MKDKLPKEIYDICFGKGTEMPFTGKYNKHYETGSYHCVCCDNLLFHSENKYDSGTGWPSFWRDADINSVKLEDDYSNNLVRTEVSCANCNAHLGHLFNDGPKPTNLRYCINSLTLNFKKEV